MRAFIGMVLLSGAMVFGIALADGHEVAARGKKPSACKSSGHSCRPSVHHGTGCSGGGCDCNKGEICAPNPHASPRSAFSGQCVCG